MQNEQFFEVTVVNMQSLSQHVQRSEKEKQKKYMWFKPKTAAWALVHRQCWWYISNSKIRVISNQAEPSLPSGRLRSRLIRWAPSLLTVIWWDWADTGPGVSLITHPESEPLHTYMLTHDVESSLLPQSLWALVSHRWIENETVTLGDIYYE